jgi:hypothetical protein
MLEGWGSGGAGAFVDEVKVAEGNGQRLGWVAAEDFGGEAADCDASTADGVKDGGVGREIKGTVDIGGEISVFNI